MIGLTRPEFPLGYAVDSFPGPRSCTVDKDYSGLDSGTFSERLWKLAWQGGVTSRGFGAIRQGIETGFRAYEPGDTPGRKRGSGRGSFSKCERSKQISSLWQSVVVDEMPEDLIEEEEMNRERVRILLARVSW